MKKFLTLSFLISILHSPCHYLLSHLGFLFYSIMICNFHVNFTNQKSTNTISLCSSQLDWVKTMPFCCIFVLFQSVFSIINNPFIRFNQNQFNLRFQLHPYQSTACWYFMPQFIVIFNVFLHLNWKISHFIQWKL